MARYSTSKLADDLRRLGLGAGDMVLVRAALRPLGDVERNRATTFIAALLDVLGPKGTLIGLAFNSANLRPKREPDRIVTAETPSASGGLANAMVGWPGAVRSRHPTNSFVAIGRQAAEVVRGHDGTAACFQPMERLLEQDGKMVLVGCLESSPGFSTVHWAQVRLGLATRTLMKGRQGVYFRDGGRVRLFRRKDVPGCSRGFGRFYPVYEREGVLRTGRVGDADSMLIRARDAYDIEHRVLKRNPRFALCENADCFSCRGTLLYNVRDMPKYYVTRTPSFIRRATRRT